MRRWRTPRHSYASYHSSCVCFGYHLAGDGYSATIQLQRTSCPSLPVLLLIVYNPQHLTALVTVVGIPLYRQVIVKIIPKVETIQMLTKMWVGLYFSLLQIVRQIIHRCKL